MIRLSSSRSSLLTVGPSPPWAKISTLPPCGLSDDAVVVFCLIHQKAMPVERSNHLSHDNLCLILICLTLHFALLRFWSVESPGNAHLPTLNANSISSPVHSYSG